METRDILAIIFAVACVAGITFGGLNRLVLRRGLGTQFNRYIAMVVAMPIAATMALQGMLTESLVAVILGALGYAFAGFVRDDG